MEAAFQARQEVAEERWRAERDDMQQKLDQALTFMQSLGSAMGVSPPQFPLAPLVRRAETPPIVSGFDSYRVSECLSDLALT